MYIPTIVFGVLLSTLIAALYHLFRGGSSKKLLLYLILSWAGFWLGDTLAFYTGWSFLTAGVLNAGMGSLVSIACLIIGDVITQILDRDKEN
jgi:hypothetical protein